MVDARPNVGGVPGACLFCDVVAGRVAAFEVLRDDVAVAFLIDMSASTDEEINKRIDDIREQKAEYPVDLFPGRD